MMNKSDAAANLQSLGAVAKIDERIATLGGWRGKTLARMRSLIHEALPDVVEEWKWMGTPVWEHNGGICTGEAYKAAVKLTFHHGASLGDPTKLFNSSLDGNVRRAIDIHEGETIDAAAFKALVRAAAARNAAKKAPAKKATMTTQKTTQKATTKKATKKKATKKKATKKATTKKATKKATKKKATQKTTQKATKKKAARPR